jgi:Major tropism determinant N-terminal domain
MSQCKTTPARFQLRRDTADAWTARNPTLASGEIGYEANTNRMKIGDGLTPWRTLGYFPPNVIVDSVFDGGTPGGFSSLVSPETIDCGGVV